MAATELETAPPANRLRINAPILLDAGCGEGSEGAFEAVARRGFVLQATSDPEQAMSILTAGSVAVLCVGPGLSGEGPGAFLRRVVQRFPGTPNANLLFGPEGEIDSFADLIAEGSLFYLSRTTLPARDLEPLIASAAETYFARFQLLGANSDERLVKTLRAQHLSATLRRLAQQGDPADLAQLLAESAREILTADRAYCLLYDPRDQELWAKDAGSRHPRRESAAVGLASFVLRSGLTVNLPQADQDPRFDREADDPGGQGCGCFLATPIRGFTGKVVAVLIAVRRAAAQEFSPSDREAVEELAAQASTYFVPYALQCGLEGDAKGSGTSAQQRLFRPEAFEFHKRSFAEEHGDPLAVSPGWTRWAQRLLAGCLLLGFLFICFAEVPQYANGPAVVRLGGGSELTALSAGTVAAVAVRPGQRVAAGEVLVRFHGAQEAAQLKRINQEFMLQLVNRLRDLSDRSAEQALVGLRAERELALANLDERLLRAPRAGVIGDLRVKPGSYLNAGQVVLSILYRPTKPSVVIMLPGTFRPLLKPGMPVRLELEGYRFAYQQLRIDAVGEQVVSPNEALRYLGPGDGDALELKGPVVIVEAGLLSNTFQLEGKRYRYHDGMQGLAEVRVRSEKILFTLAPFLRSLTAND
jgi:biotin carboxyl carrier protein